MFFSLFSYSGGSEICINWKFQLTQFCLFPTSSISKGPIIKSCLIKSLLALQFIYNFPFQGILICQTQPPKFPNRCLKFINKEPMSLLERRAAFMRLGSRVWEMRALTQAPNLKIPSSGQSTQLSGCLEFGSWNQVIKASQQRMFWKITLSGKPGFFLKY